MSDNGVGKALDEKFKGTGFGTQLVDLLTRTIDMIIGVVTLT
jgi:two-component sensor histidine kinase